VLLVAVAGVGCGGNELRTLSHADVTGLPAGNATGTTFSGQYLTTSNVVVACRCRAGSCAALHGNVGATLSGIQMDGSFQLGAGAQLAQGGIDSDGTFHLGFSLEEPGNVQYALLDGHVTTAAGAPTGMTFTQHATGKNELDCDIVSSGEARYVGPLTTAFGAAPAPPETDFAFGWRAY
jgi:hypothetical protein